MPRLTHFLSQSSTFSHEALADKGFVKAPLQASTGNQHVPLSKPIPWVVPVSGAGTIIPTGTEHETGSRI